MRPLSLSFFLASLPTVKTQVVKAPPPQSTTKSSPPVDGFDDMKVDAKVKLGEVPTTGSTELSAEQWLKKPPTPGDDGSEIVRRLVEDKSGAVLDGLLAKGKLDDVFSKMSGTAEKKLLEKLPSLVQTPDRAADVITAMLKSSASDEHRLAAFHVFDAQRKAGTLDACLTRLTKTNPGDQVVADLVRRAKPKRLPEAILHRGSYGDTAPENTLEGLKYAVDGLGVKKVEIDLSMTKDGHIVLWHDTKPDLISWIRERGWEGMPFKPTFPDGWGQDLQGVHQMDLKTVQSQLGYERCEGKEKPGEKWTVPTLDEVVKYAKERPELSTLALDVKLPPGHTQLHQRFAKELDRVLTENGISPERVFLMSPDAGVVKQLKGVLGDKYPVSHDIEMVAAVHTPKSTLPTSKQLDTDALSIGRPRIGLDGYDSYLTSVRRDRSMLDAKDSKKPLFAWTINDELELREVIGEGVDGIITDNPLLLEKVLAKYRVEQ